MSESNVNVTPGSGGPNIDLEVIDNGNARQVVCLGNSTAGAAVAPVDSVKGMTTLAYQVPADLGQSVTGATGAAVTVTLPAVASQSHYIVLIQVKKYFTAANAASATPLVVTSTNIPGPLAFTFGQPLGVIGNTDQDLFSPSAPLKSLVAGTPTTIVCPATTGIIWRVNVQYYVAP